MGLSPQVTEHAIVNPDMKVKMAPQSRLKNNSYGHSCQNHLECLVRNIKPMSTYGVLL